MKAQHTVREIAEHIGGSVLGDGSRTITGARSVAEAGPEDIVFVDNPRFLDELAGSRAGAVILPEHLEPPEGLSGIRVAQAAVGMARALELLYPRRRTFSDVSPQAFLGRDVELGEGVGVGPGAYIGDRVRVGRGTEIHAGVTVGADAVIGEDCLLYPGVHLYAETRVGNRVILHSGVVLGADGFGFTQERVPGEDASAEEPLRHRKMPQIGRVVVEDDVEIGANTTVDRAALEETVIGRGTKIDDLVMIGHNCRVGRHTILVAQAGISGSSVLGDYVTVAGQAGLAGHIRIGSRAIIGAKAGVTKDVPEGRILLGAPAIDARQARKAYSQIEHLPEFKKQLAECQKRVADLEARLGSGE
jgi:UDP-3-O-[3-hydroxymyristoyl] glucosamine N-acyltransferase